MRTNDAGGGSRASVPRTSTGGTTGGRTVSRDPADARTATPSTGRTGARTPSAPPRQADTFARTARPPTQAAIGGPVDPAAFPPGQRDKAVEICKNAPPGSVGAAIYPLLSSATSVVRNAAAGNVGDFYESQKELLHSPATDANIEKFTQLETQFFEGEGPAARLAAKLLTSEMRADLVKMSRDLQQK